MNIVAVTSCPTGIAHTFMAAEALQKAARALGHTIKVETQGSVEAKNQLTPEDTAAADAVIIAAETNVDTSRFAGKPLYSTSTKHAMKAGTAVIRTALAQPAGGSAPGNLAGIVEHAKAERAASHTGPYKHLMTGVSYMLPVDSPSRWRLRSVGFTRANRRERSHGRSIKSAEVRRFNCSWRCFRRYSKPLAPVTRHRTRRSFDGRRGRTVH